MKQFGRYEVIEEIGAGAMGAVFKARDPMMDREVAVKTIHASALIGPMAEQYRERFTREARAAGRLAHPGIVTVFDAGVEGDTPYLVMEFVPGRSLEAVLTGEHLPIEKVYEIGQQLAEALGYAHANGVVHRDIKPANIQLTGSPERAKIMDFGVAKLTQAQVTSTGTLLGTPAYMAPEQFTGMVIDGRSDLFSLGVILYWMATGDKPFSGDTITAVSYKIVHTEPIAPRQLNPGVPAPLEAIILKCLAKDPAARHQSGDELAADLAALRGNQPYASSSGIRQSPPADAISSAVTMPLGSSAQMRQSAISGEAAPPKPPAPPPPARTATPAPSTPRPPAPGVPLHVARTPEPKSSGGKAWLYVVAVLLVLGLLWGAGVAKKKKEAAELAASQQAQTPPVVPAAPATTSATPTTPSNPPAEAAPPPATETKAPAPAKRPPTAAAAAAATPKEEKPPPEPDVSGFALRLEVTASAPATVEITADDNPVQMRSLRAGGSLKAGATKIFQVRTDNAGALHLKLNDQDMPDLGPLGSPRTMRLTAKNLASSSTGSASSGTSHRPAAKTQVDVEVANLPKFADLAVRVDGQILFEREGVMQGGTDSISRTEAIPPGTHTITVFVGNQKLGKGIKHEITGDFSAGQTRTLRVQSKFEGHRGPGMFMFDLSLE